MTTDQKVQLAEQIALDLGVRHNEWEKWAQYAARRGLDEALELARAMSNSPSLRSQPKRAAQQIARVVTPYRSQLSQLSLSELQEVLGYVGRWLVAGGKSHAQGTARHTGRNTRRHYRGYR